jgi:regulator of sirC expression with transglutaminase-like and TPR domain
MPAPDFAATERFVALVNGPPAGIALDEAALLIAAHAHPGVDLPARLGQLDELARGVQGSTAPGVAAELFAPGGFAGNVTDYYDPANSYLDEVLDRKLGIPITLSVLMTEVARRIGVTLVGVGMQGHFLVGEPDHDDGVVRRWFDPFHGRAALDVDDCAALFDQLHGGSRSRYQTDAADRRVFVAEQLAPVGPLAVLDRILANLQHTLLQRSPSSAAWAVELRRQFPDVPPARQAELAATLGDIGRFSEAAAAFDALAEQLDPEAAGRATRAATEMRARAN